MLSSSPPSLLRTEMTLEMILAQLEGEVERVSILPSDSPILSNSFHKGSLNTLPFCLFITSHKGFIFIAGLLNQSPRQRNSILVIVYWSHFHICNFAALCHASGPRSTTEATAFGILLDRNHCEERKEIFQRTNSLVSTRPGDTRLILKRF